MNNNIFDLSYFNNGQLRLLSTSHYYKFSNDKSIEYDIVIKTFKEIEKQDNDRKNRSTD